MKRFRRKFGPLFKEDTDDPYAALFTCDYNSALGYAS